MIQRSRKRLIAIALTLLAAGVAGAETAYVDDQLQIGLHTDTSLDSTIVEMLPSGTSMEVLVRKDGMARVRLPDGREGWVDATFLANTAPGRTRVAELEAEVDRYKARIAELEAEVAELENERAKAARDALGETGAPAIPSETLRELQTLAEENQRLKQAVAELEAAERQAAKRIARAESGSKGANRGSAAPRSGALGIVHWERWQQILLASVLLLAFAAGGWIVDWGVRRRHGGFRV